MFYTAGIDVGSDSIKTALMSMDGQGENPQLLDTGVYKIRRRDINNVVEESYQALLTPHGLAHEDIAYLATTGEGEMIEFRRGHFYSMTAHSRGAIFLNPDIRAVVDCGALHGKAMLVDERSKVLGYRMTSQCASGSGQFLENIARYLGVPIEDIGGLSQQSENPEVVSGICAVLAETDVINMVSRGIETQDILKGIHLSMSRRLVNLMRMTRAQGKVLVTGGLARNSGFIAAMQELADKDKRLQVKIQTHELSISAGAIGAALWAGFRHVRLSAPVPATVARAS
jgi:benzoyl-CoA reductase subunit D